MKVYFEKKRYHHPIGYTSGLVFFIGFGFTHKIFKKYFRVKFGISYEDHKKEYRLFLICLFFWDILFFFPYKDRL